MVLDCAAPSYTYISPMKLSRRHFFLGSLALPALADKKPLGEQPNVLLILVDGLPTWILGCYGNREVRTPNIDRLAQTGTRFLNHYACAPVADIARAALLTGRTTMQLKDTGEVTLEKLLGAIGYACGASADGAGAARFLDAQSAAKPFFLTAGFAPYAALPDAGPYAQAQLPVALPEGDYAGPVAELPAGAWLVSYRPAATAPYGLYRWRPGEAAPEKLLTPAGQAVQPVLVQPRPVPKRHPSALGDRQGANLLCLNVYTSKLHIAGGSVAKVRVWAQSDGGSAVMLGEAPVEKDGSFFVNPPSETAIRFELLDPSGKIVAAEKGWFWARRGEQRVCVGCHAGPERAPENAVPQVLLRSAEPVRLSVPGVK